ncbi:hypothetical protein JG687_00017298, partial [Phytophthora cactorum]
VVEVIPTSAGGETRYEHLSKSIDQLNTSPPLTDDSSTSIGPTLLRGSLPSHNELPSMRISVSAYQRNTMTTTDTVRSCASSSARITIYNVLLLRAVLYCRSLASECVVKGVIFTST